MSNQVHRWGAVTSATNFIRILSIIASVLLSSLAQASEGYVKLFDRLNAEPMKHLQETVDLVEARIHAWEQALKAEHIEARRLISTPYGSAFLKFNKKGLDQDYLGSSAEFVGESTIGL